MDICDGNSASNPVQFAALFARAINIGTVNKEDVISVTEKGCVGFKKTYMRSIVEKILAAAACAWWTAMGEMSEA
jgi:hypothetical protein